MSLLPLSLRGLLAWCLLTTLGFVAVRPIVGSALPLVEATVNVMQQDYVGYVTLEQTRTGPSIRMTCSALHDLTLRSGRVIPYLRTFGCARTDAVHALVPLSIYLLLVLAWPIAAARREILWRVLGSVVLVPAVVALSTPVLLVGLVRSDLAPRALSADSQFLALVQPLAFMELGGSWLLPVLAALVGIWLGRYRAHRAAH